MSSATPRRWFAVALLAAMTAAVAPAGMLVARAIPEPAWTPPDATYTSVLWQEGVPLEMADGTELRADVHAPADPETGELADGEFPVVVAATPYGRGTGASGEGDPPSNPDLAYFVQRGYLAVIFDLRGTGGSEGDYDFFGPTDGNDTAAVVRWAATLPRSTGAVGLVGTGHTEALFQAAAAIGPDSPLKAIFAAEVSHELFKEWIAPGGLICLWCSGIWFGTTSPVHVLNGASASPDLAVRRVRSPGGSATAEIRETIVEGPDNDAYWQSRAVANLVPSIVANGIAVSMVGASRDVYPFQPLLDYVALQNAWAGRPIHAPMAPDQAVTDRFQMLYTPGWHTTLAEPYHVWELGLAWFEDWLKGSGTAITATETPLRIVDPSLATMALTRYPVPEVVPQRYHLRAGGALTPEEPPVGGGRDPLVFSGAVVPCDRVTEQSVMGVAGGAIPCSQPNRVPPSVAPGQLSYETAPFAAPTMLAGPIGATLFATATTTETAWLVKLYDVAPDGSASLLGFGSLLGSMRRTDPERTWLAPSGRPMRPYQRLAAEDAEAVVPGAMTRYDIEIGPVFDAVAAGHRIRVVVLTGDAPRNVPPVSALPRLAGGVYEVAHEAGAASSIELPLVDPAVLHEPHA